MAAKIEAPIDSGTRFPVLQSWGLAATDAESRAHEPGFGYDVVTRILDIVISVVALVLFSPLMLLIAIVVKLTSPGPILFRQVRVGCDRRKRAAGARGERRNDDVFGKPFVL